VWPQKPVQGQQAVMKKKSHALFVPGVGTGCKLIYMHKNALFFDLAQTRDLRYAQ
jgi:hypothetical protein